jgi:hypothetical protein
MSQALKILSGDSTTVTASWPSRNLALFSAITMKIRLEDGTKLTALTATIDDAPNGLFHFDIAANYITNGEHFIELAFTNLATGLTSTLPKDAPLCLVSRDSLLSDCVASSVYDGTTTIKNGTETITLGVVL